MKKQYFIVVIILAILGGAGYFIWSKTATTKLVPVQQSQQLSPTPAKSAPDQPDPAMPTTGRYITYSSTIIAETAGTKILFFHAPWCPQCRALEASIKTTAIPENVTIIKIDYDSNQKLRQQYGVTLQTTLVKVDDRGDLIEKFVAYDEPNFHSIERLLN